MVPLALVLTATAAASAPDSWRRGYSFSTAPQPPAAADSDVINLHESGLEMAAAPAPPGGTLKQAGTSVDVWAAVETLHRCGHIDVPDIPARAYVDKAGLTHMIVGSTGCESALFPSMRPARGCRASLLLPLDISMLLPLDALLLPLDISDRPPRVHRQRDERQVHPDERQRHPRLHGRLERDQGPQPFELRR